MLEKDLADNKAIGQAGCNLILSSIVSNGNGDNAVRVLTHCNTGSLATAGYGTALGVIRALHAARRLGKYFFFIYIRICLPIFKPETRIAVVFLRIHPSAHPPHPLFVYFGVVSLLYLPGRRNSN